jgi:hypothetical protein
MVGDCGGFQLRSRGPQVRRCQERHFIYSGRGGFWKKPPKSGRLTLIAQIARLAAVLIVLGASTAARADEEKPSFAAVKTPPGSAGRPPTSGGGHALAQGPMFPLVGP